MPAQPGVAVVFFLDSTRRSLFVLSGEELTLPVAEIRALVSTFDYDAAIELHGSRIVTSSISNEEIIETITQRAAYCRFGGLYLGASEDMPSLANGVDMNLSFEGKTFAVASYTLPPEKRGEIGAKIKSKTGGKVSLDSPDYLFQAERTPSGYLLGLSKSGYKEFQWRTRRPRARRFFLPSAIYPKLARLLVNLSRIRAGEYFADPFCGTGSLLIEASLMGMKSIGLEITRWIARGALLNLKGFNLDYETVIRAESTTHLPLSTIDGIATDVPYGRASSTKGLKTELIVKNFLNSVSESLRSKKRKKYCVVMHPSTINIKEIAEEGNSFQLKEQHLLYVHRTLTRAISILERSP